MHRYGDENVDWIGIEMAARFIGRGLQFWGVPVRQYKEKFGTVRVYCSFGLHYPWHYYGPNSPLRLLFWALNLVIVPLQKRLYQWYYAEACRRFPHLKKEIIYGADYYELLGGKVKFDQIYFPELGDAEPTRLNWVKE